MRGRSAWVLVGVAGCLFACSESAGPVGSPSNDVEAHGGSAADAGAGGASGSAGVSAAGSSGMGGVPTLGDDVATVSMYLGLDVDVLANDGPLPAERIVEIEEAPAHGVASVLPGGRIRYIPALLSPGLQTIKYRVSTNTEVLGKAVLSVHVVAEDWIPTTWGPLVVQPVAVPTEVARPIDYRSVFFGGTASIALGVVERPSSTSLLLDGEDPLVFVPTEPTAQPGHIGDGGEVPYLDKTGAAVSGAGGFEFEPGDRPWALVDDVVFGETLSDEGPLPWRWSKTEGRDAVPLGGAAFGRVRGARGAVRVGAVGQTKEELWPARWLVDGAAERLSGIDEIGEATDMLGTRIVGTLRGGPWPVGFAWQAGDVERIEPEDGLGLTIESAPPAGPLLGSLVDREGFVRAVRLRGAEVGEGSEVHPRAEPKDPHLAHACGHTQVGPYVDIVAGTSFETAPPAISQSHTFVRVILPAPGPDGMRTGVVRFRSAAPSKVTFYATDEAPIHVETPTGQRLLGRGGRSRWCPNIAFVHEHDVPEGEVAVVLGPTRAPTAGVVFERGHFTALGEP